MVQNDVSVRESQSQRHTAVDVAGQLRAARAALDKAEATILAAIADPHVTTSCHAGAHEACPGRCVMCADCHELCDCLCHE